MAHNPIKESSPPQEVWAAILTEMDEKMQFGLLEQARRVVEIQLDGDDLVLLVDSPQTALFFSQPMNQQRLLIMAREVIRSQPPLRVKVTER